MVKRKHILLICMLLISLCVSTLLSFDTFATSTAPVSDSLETEEETENESSDLTVSDFKVDFDTLTEKTSPFVSVINGDGSATGNISNLGYNLDPSSGGWVDDYNIQAKKSTGATLTANADGTYTFKWKYTLPKSDAFYYSKDHKARIILCAGVDTDKLTGNGFTAFSGAEYHGGYIYDGAPRASMAHVKTSKWKGPYRDYLTYGGKTYAATRYYTVTSTGYKNKQVYRLGTQSVTTSSFEDTVTKTYTTTISAATMKKIRAWCKTNGIEQDSDGNYKVYAAIAYNPCTRAGWTHECCGMHGGVWKDYSGSAGNGTHICGNVVAEAGSIGEKVVVGYNNVTTYVQDDDECEVMAYSNALEIPSAAKAEVELMDVARDYDSTEYDLVLKEYDTKEYTLTDGKATAKISDFDSTTPSYTGYNYVKSSTNPLTVDKNGGIMYRYYDPAAYTATCIDRYYKNNQLVAEEKNTTTKTVYHGQSIRGSEWGTTSPKTGYAYRNDTSVTCNAGDVTVYRNFDAQSFKVVYHTNFGTDDPKTQTVYVGDSCKLLDASATAPWKRTATYGAGYWNNAGWSTASGATNTVQYAGGSTQTFNTAANGVVNLYAVWQPSLKVEWDSGVRKASVLGSERDKGGFTFHAYNTSLENSNIVMNFNYHLKDIKVNGVSSASVIEALGQSKALMSLTDCTTILVESSQNSQVPVKRVYKHGTTIDVSGCVVSPGDKLDYSITITNMTSVPRDVVITDTLDSGVTYVSGSADNGGTYADGTLTWNISQIAAGASKTVTFTVEVNTEKQGKQVTNMAETTEKAIAALGETKDLTEYSNTVTNYVIAKPEKHLRKTVSSEEHIDNTVLVTGDKAVYTIAFTNPAGKEKEFNISDTIPKGLDIISVSDGGTVSGQKVSWGSIKVGSKETKILSVNVEVNEESQGKTFYNMATVKCMDAYGTSIDSNKTKNYGMKAPEKDVYLTLDSDFMPTTSMNSIDGRVINDGILVTYRIKWQNPTTAERTIVLKDTVPDYARIATAADLDRASEGINLSEEFDYTNGGSYLISDNGTYDEGTKTITWQFDSNSAASDDEKDSGFVEFTVVILKTAQDLHVTNKASLTLISPTGVNENNPTVESNLVDNPILKTPDKIATRDDGQNVTDLVVSDGEEITYKITFKNPADEEKDFIVTDVVPEFTKLVSGSISDGGTYDSAENLITWNVTVAANAEKTVTFKVLVLEEAQNETVKNTAKVYVDDANKTTKDAVPTNIFILEDPTKAVLNLDGEDINGVVKRVGDIITYDIVYKNPADTERVATITDVLPEGVEFVSARNQGSYDTETSQFVETSDKATYDYNKETNTIVWTVPTAAGCQEMVSVDVRIKEGTEDTILRNTASVYIPDTTKKTNEVYTPVVANPVKEAVDKAGQNLNGNFVTVGEEFTYKITVKNPADTEKEGYITDVLPTGVDFVSADNKGRYDAATHTVFWKELSLSAHQELTVTLTVRVNESAKSEIIHNEAVYRIDEAVVSSELRDGGKGGPVSYVTTKYSLNKKGEDIDKKVVTVGNTIVYKISYKNITTEERSFTIYDILPEGVEIVDIGDNGFIVKNPIEGLENYKVVEDRTVAWQFLVPAGQEGYVTVTTKVADDSITEVRNNATIMVEDINGGVPFIKDTNEVVNPVIKNPVKMVFNEEGREITDKMVTTGDVITYKITYVNPSDETKLADIKDTLPNEVKFISCDYDGVYDSVSHTVKWTGVETAAGERATVSVTVKVKDSAGGKTISNKGVVFMDEAIISTRAKTDESSPEEPEPSDKPTVDNYVACKKSYDVNGNDVTDEIVKVGDTLTYRIKYKNTSSITKHYVIKDTLPEEVDYVSATGNPTVEEKTLTWSTEAGAGTEGFFDIVVTINEKGYGKKIENVAQITENNPESPDEPYTITTSTCTNYVFDEDDFVKSVKNKNGKDMNEAVAPAGSNLYYHIRLHNPSDKKETFTVTDTLPDEVKYVSSTKGGVFDNETNTVTWELELEKDATADLEICVKIKNTVESGTVKNIAHVVTSGTEIDSNEVNTYVFAEPVKRMKVGNRELADGDSVAANTSVTFVIEYSNPTDKAREIAITDVLDKNIVNRVLEISDNGKLENGVITWYIEAEANSAGEVSFTIASPELDGVEIKNTANVSFDDEDLDGTTSFDTNTVYYIAKLDNTDRIDPGTPNIVKTGDDKSLSELFKWD